MHVVDRLPYMSVSTPVEMSSKFSKKNSEDLSPGTHCPRTYKTVTLVIFKRKLKDSSKWSCGVIKDSLTIEIFNESKI